ncbi:MAG: hypothetical protein DHS20C16_20650 [Phycisphaerae bacterium]|nr:MAG: hypothetical protein DHS20C16_20650 [Phycisphaerae bacterium]
MYFGVPADPMPEVLANAIGQVVAEVPGIIEAYLSQCYIEGDDEARQVLILGVEAKNRIPAIMQDLMGKMEIVMPSNDMIDVFPFSSSDMPPQARVEECRIWGGQVSVKKPSWRFW